MGNETNFNEEASSCKSFERFQTNLSNWIQTRGLIENNISKDEVAEIELLLKTDVAKLTTREALNLSFKFHYYIDYLYSVHNKEKAVLDWCEESIWYIIADKIRNYGDQYTKWQEKYNAAVKENPLASEINKLRNNVKARVTLLSGRLDNLKKLAEVLHDIGKKYN